MSYILAALKKSEQERKKLENASTTQITTADTSIGTKLDDTVVSEVLSEKTTSILLLSVIFSLLSLLILFGIISLTSNKEIELATVIDEAALPVETINVEQLVDKVLVKDVESARPVKEIKPLAANKPVKIRDIEQADKAQRNKLPNIEITSHIFSSQADRRSIVVNNQRLVEGDFVANQVQIKEITHQGMILEVDGVLFAVSRSRGWNR